MVGFVDTNAMKSHEIALRDKKMKQYGLWVVAVVLLVIMLGCEADRIEQPVSDEPQTLECVDCELVDVLEVKDANTIITSVGEIRMYGAYMRDKPEDCAEKAEERLRLFAGDAIRIEPGPADSVRIQPGNYYIYTKDGASIEEQLVRDGLALIWAQDGQYLGWFIYLDAFAKEHESGCLWRGWNAFQHGEPSEFRVPGLTYPDSTE